MHTVIETDVFASSTKDAGLSEDEIAAIVSTLAADPLCGDLIVGTGGARKVRFAGRAKGKSGGYRSIHYFSLLIITSPRPTFRSFYSMSTTRMTEQI